MPSCSGMEGEKWHFLMIDLRDDLVTCYLMPPIWISNVSYMTCWLARTYLKIIDHKFTVQRECGNGPLQATLSGDVIILRGCVRRNSGPFGGRENWHGYKTGSKVEAHVASCPVLSLFRREEPKDGDTVLPYTLHNYRSTATPYI